MMLIQFHYDLWSAVKPCFQTPPETLKLFKYCSQFCFVCHYVNFYEQKCNDRGMSIALVIEMTQRIKLEYIGFETYISWWVWHIHCTLDEVSLVTRELEHVFGLLPRLTSSWPRTQRERHRRQVWQVSNATQYKVSVLIAS